MRAKSCVMMKRALIVFQYVVRHPRSFVLYDERGGSVPPVRFARNVALSEQRTWLADGGAWWRCWRCCWWEVSAARAGSRRPASRWLTSPVLSAGSLHTVVCSESVESGGAARCEPPRGCRSAEGASGSGLGSPHSWPPPLCSRAPLSRRQLPAARERGEVRVPGGGVAPDGHSDQLPLFQQRHFPA